MRMVVVLPAPLGPMNPYTSPRSSFNVSRFKAYRSPYIFVRSRVSIMVVSCRLLFGFDRHEDAHVGVLLQGAQQVGALGIWRGQRSQPKAAGVGRVLRDRLGSLMP